MSSEFLAKMLRQLAEQMERETEEREVEIREKWKLVEFPDTPTDDRKDMLRGFIAMESLVDQILMSGSPAPKAESLIAGAVIGALLVKMAGAEWTERMLIADEENLENLTYAASFIRSGYAAASEAELRAGSVYEASKKGSS